jgi:hypothetical protein
MTRAWREVAVAACFCVVFLVLLIAWVVPALMEVTQ